MLQEQIPLATTLDGRQFRCPSGSAPMMYPDDVPTVPFNDEHLYSGLTTRTDHVFILKRRHDGDNS